MPLRRFLKKVRGKRIAIGGNRRIGPRTRGAVRNATGRLIGMGYSIVTGGAEGADHEVMKACLARPERITVFLPCTIEGQYRHYRKLEGAGKAGALLSTLRQLKEMRPASVMECRRKFSNYREAADYRNTLIVRQSSGFIVFKPAGSRGCGDAIRKIMRSAKPCLVFG